MPSAYTKYKDIILKVLGALLIVGMWQAWNAVFPRPSGVETSLNRGVWLLAVESHQPQQPLYRLDLSNRDMQGDIIDYAWMSRRPSATTIASDDIATVAIPEREGQVLTDLYTQWCQQAPTFRSLQPDEMYYDVGVGCGPFHQVKQRNVPAEDLPVPLKTLFQRLLPPEARMP